MDTSLLDFTVLTPIACVGVAALMVLLADALAPARGVSLLLVTIATLSLLVALYLAWSMFGFGVDSVFNPERPMLRLDALSSMAVLILSLAGLLSVWLSASFLPTLGIHDGEYYALLLLSIAGMFVLVMSVDLISVFMGYELMSVPIYALAAFDRRSLKSNESGLKYFLIGAFASAILLYGMALLYGATGHTDFVGIAASPGLSNSLARAGIALMVVGVAFKVSLVPFHHWTPDVYEGAPTSVIAFMAVTVKCSVFVILIRVLSLLSPELNEVLSDVFWVLAVLTMVVGTLMALIQSNLKRLLAYSSVSHAGVMLIAVVVGSHEAHAALLFYLMIYVFMNAGVFGVIVALSRDGEDCERIDDLAGLARRRPGLAGALTLFMLALAGIPGTGGFMAKFLVFSAAVGDGYIWLTILGVMASGVAAFNYLRLPMVMYMGESVEEAEESDATRELGSFDMAVLILCSVAVFYLGILPDRTPFVKAAEALPQRPSATRIQSQDSGLSAAQDADVALPAGDVELVE